MKTFLNIAHSQITGLPGAVERGRLLDVIERQGLPTTTDEVWRYAPLSQFNIDTFGAPERSEASPAFINDLTHHADIVVQIDNGRYVAAQGDMPGVHVSWRDEGAIDEAPYQDDAFALLNTALHPHVLSIEVDTDVSAGTVLLVHRVGTGASFPRTRISVSRNARLTVIEVWCGGTDAFVAPVSEFEVGDNAHLTHVTYQRLDSSAWHVSRTTARIERSGRMHQSVLCLGGQYDRARNDAELVGPGAENQLWTTFLGSGDQVHDLRSHQMHHVGRTNSVLLSKGAAADRSRSVYTGLIEIERGARRTDARQTNHNLLLSPQAHADSVPNLDIRENDVTCAHASSVGPLDELQRWYLESRGVSRQDAERLMIEGFFKEMLDVLPTDVARVFEADITVRVREVVA
ncbi:MAG: SufD family Fe-S cluster assembly protein [Acidobacteria bacterium]|nr:SufD family Fe-S cluster assembly protein [Acidobacteriota bacterium]